MCLLRVNRRSKNRKTEFRCNNNQCKRNFTNYCIRTRDGLYGNFHIYRCECDYCGVMDWDISVIITAYLNVNICDRLDRPKFACDTDEVIPKGTPLIQPPIGTR